jgi:hypothetical protein
MVKKLLCRLYSFGTMLSKEGDKLRLSRPSSMKVEDFLHSLRNCFHLLSMGDHFNQHHLERTGDRGDLGI